MATPRADSCSAPSGAVLACGRAAPSGLPSWVAAAVPGRWGEVPVAAALSTLNPLNNPAINPNHPGSPEWYGSTGFNGILVPWCGACYNADGDELWLPLGGGHNDYGGNEPYKLALAQEVPAWSMVRPPSGAIGNLLTTNDGQEASGVYSDGRPRSIHSYNKPVWVPGVGPYIAAQGNTWYSGQAGTNRPIAIDPVTGEGTLKTACPASLPYRINAGCHDPTRGTQGSIWSRSSGTAKMQRYDVAADSWTIDLGSSAGPTNYLGMAYMPEHDCILISAGDGWRVFDCQTYAYTSPTFSGSSPLSVGSCQPIWINGKAYAWNNSSDTTEVTRLTPGANPRTDTWTVDTLTVDGGNTVTPAARQANGTYGRFAYSPNLGIFVLVNSTSGAVHFFRPAAAL